MEFNQLIILKKYYTDVLKSNGESNSKRVTYSPPPRMMKIKGHKNRGQKVKWITKWDNLQGKVNDVHLL